MNTESKMTEWDTAISEIRKSTAISETSRDTATVKNEISTEESESKLFTEILDISRDTAVFENSPDTAPFGRKSKKAKSVRGEWAERKRRDSVNDLPPFSFDKTNILVWILPSNFDTIKNNQKHLILAKSAKRWSIQKNTNEINLTNRINWSQSINKSKTN